MKKGMMRKIEPSPILYFEKGYEKSGWHQGGRPPAPVNEIGCKKLANNLHHLPRGVDENQALSYERALN